MADPIKSIGLQGGPKKLQKGNADVESGGQPIMFAPLIEKASQINTEGDKKMIINSPPPGKGENPLLIKEEEFVFLKENNGKFSKDGQGKSGIKNLLKYSALKVEGTIGEHEKTGVKKLTGHNTKILHNEITLPTRLVDKISSVAEYHQTDFHTVSRTGKKHLMGGVTPKSQKPEVNKLGAESGSLKSGLTGTIVGKDEAFKKSRVAVVKNSNGKNDTIKQLKHSALKVEGTIGEHEKTGVKELTGHNTKILHNEIALPTRLVDKTSSVVEYHQTGFNADGKMVAVNESVNRYSKEPRVLINQIAKGVNGPGRVKIALTPPHLGTLDMDVIVRNNKVQIIIQAENNDVRQILQSNVETLKNALSSQGLIADSINVIIQEKSESLGYFGFGRDETLFKEDNNQKENQRNPKGRKDSLDRVSSLFDEENPRIRIDGRISFFV